METASPIQARFEQAIDNYLELSAVLQNDFNALLDQDDGSQRWRRNFIRESASLIEGYTSCIGELGKIGLDCPEAPPITEKQRNAIQLERSCRTNDRIRLTALGVHSLFNLPPLEFGVRGWVQAQLLFDKRDELMHPKNPTHMEVSDALFAEVHDGAVWLMAHLFGFFSSLQLRV
jgi:hypothetical protein